MHHVLVPNNRSKGSDHVILTRMDSYRKYQDQRVWNTINNRLLRYVKSARKIKSAQTQSIIELKQFNKYISKTIRELKD